MDWAKLGITNPYYSDDWVAQIGGDALLELPKLPSDSIDLIATDPPYGLSFMGKDWDKAVPPVEVWRECLRVLKAGAFAFVMCIPRQDCLGRMIANLQDAGFRTDFTSLYWCYASGFPKSENISKCVDRRLGVKREVIGKKDNIHSWKAEDNTGQTYGKYGKTFDEVSNITTSASPQAKTLDGSYGGFQPKPALEVILVAMKPLSGNTFVDQALKNKKGITWLDDGRIPSNSIIPNLKGNKQQWKEQDGRNPRSPIVYEPEFNPSRFPANLLCSNDVLNDGISRASGIGDKHGKSKTLFQQSDPNNRELYEGTSIGGDTGSFSRYFDLDMWWQKQIEQLPESAQKTFPFLIVPKASKSEKNKGCNDLEPQAKPLMGEFKDNPNRTTPKSSPTPRSNYHPTVKPLKLMSYLITIGSRAGDIVLDPFIGSGTTAIACKIQSRYCVGIEIKPDYSRINELRVAQPLQPFLQL